MRLMRRNRQLLETADKHYLRNFSPITFLNVTHNGTLLRHFCRGRLLDAGAGYLHNKPLAMPYCDSYESLDITRLVGEVDHLGDVQDMTSISSEAYDSVLLTHVLEHLPRPGDALRECRRILGA